MVGVMVMLVMELKMVFNVTFNIGTNTELDQSRFYQFVVSL